MNLNLNHLIIILFNNESIVFLIILFNNKSIVFSVPGFPGPFGMGYLVNPYAAYANGAMVSEFDKTNKQTSKQTNKQTKNKQTENLYTAKPIE